jgi:hypothetical protein
LMILAEYADAAGVAWPAVDTIAHQAQLDSRQVRRLLNRLHADGWIRPLGSRKGGHAKTVRWALEVHRLTAPNPDTKDSVSDRSILTPKTGSTLTSEAVNPDTRGIRTLTRRPVEPVIEPVRTDITPAPAGAPARDSPTAAEHRPLEKGNVKIKGPYIKPRDRPPNVSLMVAEALARQTLDQPPPKRKPTDLEARVRQLADVAKRLKEGTT